MMIQLLNNRPYTEIRILFQSIYSIIGYATKPRNVSLATAVSDTIGVYVTDSAERKAGLPQSSISIQSKVKCRSGANLYSRVVDIVRNLILCSHLQHPETN